MLKTRTALKRDEHTLQRRGEQCIAKPLSYETLEPRQLLSANAVVEWNEVLLDAIRLSKVSPPVASRAMAIVHTAIYDAVNSIDGRFQAYHALAPVHPKASTVAAVAGAAERTLSALFPSLSATFSVAFDASLASVPAGVRADQGVAVGRWVADQILALRADDQSDLVVPYAPGNQPGDWRPTPSGFLASLLPNWPQVTPWAMSSGNQFRASGPPALTSEDYAADINYVKEIGAVQSATRTAEQTDIALIWAAGPGTATPPGQWNMIAQEVVQSTGVSLVDSARLFALLNVAVADAAISAWDSKYAYDFWRPVTAIREAATDGNPATIQDADWLPLIATPPFPSYTSGHSTFSGAASTVLERFFRTDAVSFTLKSEVASVADRHFTSFKYAAEEAGVSRIYGGIHYGFDNLDALRAGREIGHHVSDQLLRRRHEASALRDGGQLYVNGTALGDRIFINRVGTDVVVRHQGQLIGRFTLNGLDRIVVNGGDGADRIQVTASVSVTTELFGGRGHDRMFGGSGRNWIYGEGGNDVLFGGQHDDVIRSGGGNDRLHGLGGHDYLNCQGGWNWMWGGPGNDTLVGKQDKDKSFGGAGQNHFVWK